MNPADEVRRADEASSNAADDASDTHRFRALIRERIADADQQIERLTSNIRDVDESRRDVVTDDEHDPEGTTATLERAGDVAILSGLRATRADLEAALARLDEGTYGTCENCVRPIPVARLEVRPGARLCVACASKPARR